MYRGKLLSEWDQTALLWAQIANQWRDEKETPATVFDVHPLRTPDGRVDEQPQEVESAPSASGFWQRINLMKSLPEDQQPKVIESMFSEDPQNGQ